jgi:hypothetical protein
MVAGRYWAALSRGEKPRGCPRRGYERTVGRGTWIDILMLPHLPKRAFTWRWMPPHNAGGVFYFGQWERPREPSVPTTSPSWSRRPAFPPRVAIGLERAGNSFTTYLGL